MLAAPAFRVKSDRIVAARRVAETSIAGLRPGDALCWK
jgi:hypothetical protein